MIHPNKVFVSIQFDEEEIELGELVSDGQRIYFRYYSSFIKKGIEISPFKLKLNDSLNVAKEIPFGGLFGVFADSLPDGWGQLLLDRTLAARGHAMEDITPLDRLLHVGSRGMGALMYRPEVEEERQTEFHIELDEIAESTDLIHSGVANDVLDELYKLGGSSGGARPKILVGYNPTTNHLIRADNILPEEYEHWLIKFPSSAESPNVANIEYAYYKMALDAGIEMSEAKLFRGKSGRAYFGTKRFDRQGNKRLHMHSAAGLLNDNFRLSTLDYGHIMHHAFLLENDVRAYEKILRLAAFNVFAHNRDDHSKNIAFLMDENGAWKTAPAYDLTFSSSGHGWQSTMIAGVSANPTKRNLFALADSFKVKKAKNIIEEVLAVVKNWSKYAEEANVTNESKYRIDRIIGRAV
jgi:serine/threonine-protein kinase HipA